MRAVTGFCCRGLYVVSEIRLNARTRNQPYKSVVGQIGAA